LGDPDYDNLFNYHSYLPNAISQTDVHILKQKVKEMTLTIQSLEAKIEQSPIS